MIITNQIYELKDIYSKECIGAVYKCDGEDIPCIILGEFRDRLKVKGYFLTKINKPYEQIRLIYKDKLKYIYMKDKLLKLTHE